MKSVGRPARKPLSERPAWSQRLQAARLNKGLSQAELASQTGLAQSTIADYEVGRTEPSRRVLEVIAKALGVDALELVYGPFDNSKPREELYDQIRSTTPSFAYQDNSDNDVAYIKMSHALAAAWKRHFPLSVPTGSSLAGTQRLVWRIVMQLPDTLPMDQRIDTALAMFESSLGAAADYAAQRKGGKNDQNDNSG
ncbi:helix-turn-helix domain-containing protein [Pararoseomonas indoligenes]|uniref:Helix-turn-helix transcriptional regulator n=1 Tax=Roseomonas indoligenes TaxID=2820811 RepID=A0A940MXL6_9PROT|nr:helix-turn-helix transcriptional regulator [Pararoseomonas indoligenes]MBP0493052.1 helix-turn-helix transcriptional regulator [Pararoseomonas indoligenes]